MHLQYLYAYVECYLFAMFCDLLSINKLMTLLIDLIWLLTFLLNFLTMYLQHTPTQSLRRFLNCLFPCLDILFLLAYALWGPDCLDSSRRQIRQWKWSPNDSRVQRRLWRYRPQMNSPQRSHQLSCVWLQGWKSCPHPGLHVSQSGSSRRTRSPTIRTTFSLHHLSRVGPARGGGLLGGANSMRSSGVKSCSSISSHFAILGTQEAEKHGSVGHGRWFITSDHIRAILFTSNQADRLRVWFWCVCISRLRTNMDHSVDPTVLI